MIIIDKPQQLGWFYGRSSHLMSTLPGEAGSAELLAFAKRLGMNPKWLQNAGTETEHFDVTVRRGEEAVRLGARVVDKYELVAAIREKRAAMQRAEVA